MKLALVIAIIIAVFAVLVFVVKRFRNPKIRGPALTGTAQILSVQPTTGPVRQGGGLPLRIGLRVQVPGRQPYDVAVKRALGSESKTGSGRWGGGPGSPSSGVRP